MALKRGIVKLEAYNKNWKKEYQKEEKILKDILKDKIIEIEHVGSTSIEGLQAKPIIDILIVIKSFDKISEIEKLLKDYGYINHGDHGIPNRCFFTKGPDDARIMAILIMVIMVYQIDAFLQKDQMMPELIILILLLQIAIHFII